jgi:hypothetical protein
LRPRLRFSSRGRQRPPTSVQSVVAAHSLLLPSTCQRPPPRRNPRLLLCSPSHRSSSNNKHRHSRCLPGFGSWVPVLRPSSCVSQLFSPEPEPFSIHISHACEWQECSQFLRPVVLIEIQQGRAALVALRRSGGGAGALGRSYYKGGFEPKMTRREAALILEMPYAHLRPTAALPKTNTPPANAA